MARIFESGTSRKIRETRETLELRALESQLGLYGAAGYPYNGYDSWRDIYLRQPMGSQLVPPNMNNQGRGEVLPVYLNDYGLKVLRDLSRLQCRENEYAAGAVKMLTTLAVGEGMTYDCEGIDDSTSPELIAAVQDVVDEFSERTHWPEAEQEAVERSHVDGEVFLEWFPQGDGTLDFRFVEPEWVRTPSGEGYDGRHSFGIETAPGDVNTVLGYHVVRDPLHGQVTEFVEVDHITHWMANTRRTAKRGLPTFYSVRENLERAEKLLRNTGILAQVAATFAVLREHSGTQAGAENMRTSLTQSAGNNPVTGQDRRVQVFEPGAVIDHHQGVKYTISPANLQAEGYMTTHAAELRAVAACLCWPEYLVSADASNGNYSSLKVAESPTVKDSKRNQATWARRFAVAKYRGRKIVDPPVMLRVIDWAVTCRRLPPEALTQVRVIATPPVLEVRDPQQTVAVQERRLVMGVTSRRAICTENGEDYEQVKRDLANEPETPEGGKAKGQTVKDSPGTDATAAPVTVAPKGGSQDPEANGNGTNGTGRDRAGAVPFWREVKRAHGKFSHTAVKADAEPDDKETADDSEPDEEDLDEEPDEDTTDTDAEEDKNDVAERVDHLNSFSTATASDVENAVDNAAHHNAMLERKYDSAYRIKYDHSTRKFTQVSAKEFNAAEERETLKAVVRAAHFNEQHAEVTALAGKFSEPDPEAMADDEEAHQQHVAAENQALAKKGSQFRLSFDPTTNTFEAVHATTFKPREEAKNSRQFIANMRDREEKQAEDRQDAEHRDDADALVGRYENHDPAEDDPIDLDADNAELAANDNPYRVRKNAAGEYEVVKV